MLIFLYGPDSYRSKQKLKEIINHYQKIHKSGLNLRFFDGETLSFEDFRDEFQESSMFSEKKFFILKNIFLNQSLKEKFLENIKKISDSRNIILFFEEREIPKNDTFFKLLKEKAKFQEFELLEGQKLKNWIKKEVGKYQCQIDEMALEKLVEFVGNDLWRLSNEIKKLISYVEKEKKIKTKDIELLVKPKIEIDIFKIIDAFGLKNKKKALEMVHQYLKKENNPLYLLSMINYQFRNLLIIKDLIEKQQPYYLILKKTGLNPFVVKKNYQQSNNFTFQELKRIYHKISDLDFNIKTGRITPEIALDLFIGDLN